MPLQLQPNLTKKIIILFLHMMIKFPKQHRINIISKLIITITIIIRSSIRRTIIIFHMELDTIIKTPFKTNLMNIYILRSHMKEIEIRITNLPVLMRNIASIWVIKDKEYHQAVELPMVRLIKSMIT